MELKLCENVHIGLDLPEGATNVSLVQGSYKYYHYLCDGVDDRGWGCGYRTLQTLCSWITLRKSYSKQLVPQIEEIQECLVKIGDKPETFRGSKDWIGSVEVALCIDQFYGVPCKIIHIESGEKLPEYVPQLDVHFSSIGCPVMMGGDKDSSSKGIFGVCTTNSNAHLLVLDPHYNGSPSCSIQYLQDNGWIKWRPVNSFFDKHSFYNVCLPQYKA